MQSIKDAGSHFNFRCPLDAEYKIEKRGLTHTKRWCPWPDSNWHSQKGLDFKSNVSTYFTTRAHRHRFLNHNSMINNTKDFDFDLARGVNSEKSISKILGIDADKFEVKSEFGFGKSLETFVLSWLIKESLVD